MNADYRRPYATTPERHASTLAQRKLVRGLMRKLTAKDGFPRLTRAAFKDGYAETGDAFIRTLPKVVGFAATDPSGRTIPNVSHGAWVGKKFHTWHFGQFDGEWKLLEHFADDSPGIISSGEYGS